MPLTRRQIYSRRRVTVFGGIALVLGTGFYLPLTLLAPIAQVSAQVEEWQAPAPSEPEVAFPSYGASGVGAIGYSGVLASSGTTDPLPIASITKVITALVVLDAKPLALGESGPDLTFSETDVQYYNEQLALNGVVVEVYPGLVVSQRHALDVMLMASANNYAESITDWAFGSRAAFLESTSSWLERQGLASTTVTDPTGIEPSNASTVADLVELARIALADPVVAEIVGTVSVEIPILGTIDNRNELLGIDGVDGIKTGTLDESGACLLFSADEVIGERTVTLVGVVLGGPDHPTVATDVRALIEQATAGFREVSVVAAGDEFAQYETPWGDVAAAVAVRDESLLLWSATPVAASIEALPVSLAGAGTAAGSVVFSGGDQTVTVPLELSATLDDPGAWWRLTNPARLF